MKKETYEFCRIIDLLEKRAQLLYEVELDEDSDKYQLKVTIYFMEMGKISLTFCGFDEREDAIESMYAQNIESALHLYDEFKKITEGNLSIFED